VLGIVSRPNEDLSGGIDVSGNGRERVVLSMPQVSFHKVAIKKLSPCKFPWFCVSRILEAKVRAGRSRTLIIKNTRGTGADGKGRALLVVRRFAAPSDPHPSGWDCLSWLWVLGTECYRSGQIGSDLETLKTWPTS
jgi:hypothetical protein